MAVTKTIEFLDDVKISRATGNKDEWGNPQRELIYEGKCIYREGRIRSRDIVIQRMTVYIPELVIVEINDHVEVTTRFGRKVKGLVDVPHDIEMPLHKDNKLVKIELKQAN